MNVCTVATTGEKFWVSLPCSISLFRWLMLSPDLLMLSPDLLDLRMEGYLEGDILEQRASRQRNSTKNLHTYFVVARVSDALILFILVSVYDMRSSTLPSARKLSKKLSRKINRAF